ncbi:hypothetical protein [Okeania sp. SIO2B3]|uniref:hypothetical protein n=1 Tax=Okeania sp. SIO2B3 TaxID=2607784 RepID=UPI0013C160C1|nr:hypothetical protein [Okeania sp. SIO2B3]NET46707.1 hypothetical protein [Okeania sp. SIO2B3]
MTKPYCKDLDLFPSLSDSIGDYPASLELSCLLSHSPGSSFHPSVGSSDDFYGFTGGLQSLSTGNITTVISVVSLGYILKKIIK